MKLGTSDRWRAAYKILTVCQIISAAALTVTSVAAQYEVPPRGTGIVYDMIGDVKQYAFYIVAIANFVLWSAHAIKIYIGNPWAWESVKVLLEDFRAEVFDGYPDVSAHRDRVTLFRKRDKRWRCGFIPSFDWLCAVERTGHMTRRRRKWLRAKDNGLNYDGVAGATWCSAQTTLKEGLPILGIEATNRDISTYAKESFASQKYVKKRLMKGAAMPRSLCGILVEVDNKPWGVIVIDSQFERLRRKDVIEGFYQKNANVLAKLLAVL